MDRELSDALDDLILGRGVARGRHSLLWRDRLVTAEFEERLARNGFEPTTVRDVPIEPGEKMPAFYLHGGTADFGYIRWEIFTPKSRRKLFASVDRRADNQEWAVQLNLSSLETIWADPARREPHDVESAVAVNP
jgi:hypothetical protein